MHAEVLICICIHTFIMYIHIDLYYVYDYVCYASINIYLDYKMHASVHIHIYTPTHIYMYVNPSACAACTSICLNTLGCIKEPKY